MIVVVDYGMGNLRSVSKALEEVGAKVKVSDDPKAVSGADKLVVPGVGAFKDAMRELRTQRLIEPIKKFVKSDRPFLGLCLGLQLLFSESEEGGRSEGLDIIKGRVLRFPKGKLKIPHMGWNQLRSDGKCPLLKGIPDGSYMYFVHSYYAEPNEDRCIAAWTDYGIEFPSVVWSKNIYATQFHPEKSQRLGLKILRNYVRL
ncbi:MAG: imidazole glycerol phosphate synthase subunit HisH [Candidatus Omnitrophota bacterium]|nr:imidazole glycerol phosphate synthase subunit HisH [Candidatus Omnitrophota bacterium]